MLTKNEIKRLYSDCLLDDHILIEVDNVEYSEESLLLRDAFNFGDGIKKEDLFKLPTSETLYSEKITEKEDLTLIINYVEKQGRDFQSLFCIKNTNYLSLFVDKENINEEFRNKILEKYFYTINFKDIKFELCISFPENEAYSD